MKLQKGLLILVVLLISIRISAGQEAPKAVLVDEFGKICSEELMARYDGFLMRSSEEPTAAAYVVFYGADTLEGRNLNFFAMLKKYPEMRKVDSGRFVFRRGENRPQMRIQFWIVPPGADAPPPVKEFVPGKIVTTTLFDKNWADFYRDEYSRKLEIYANGFYDLGCEFSPNVKEFAQILLSNPELTGYLITYTKFGKGLKRGKQVADFAVRDLVRNHRLPRRRIKTIYGGNREEPEIELWLVPKGEKPPTPKPGAKPKK